MPSNQFTQAHAHAMVEARRARRAKRMADQSQAEAAMADVASPLDISASEFNAGVPDFIAGSLPTSVAKVPFRTTFFNRNNAARSFSPLGCQDLTAGNGSTAWLTDGTGFRRANGDLTVGRDPRRQRRYGDKLATLLNDENYQLGVMGRDWREIRVVNTTTIGGSSLTLVPYRDTHVIFVHFNDAGTFTITLTGVVAEIGMKFMFVNLIAQASRQLIIVNTAGFKLPGTGASKDSISLERGQLVVLEATPAAASLGVNYAVQNAVGSVTYA